MEKVVLITGVSSGFGRKTAELLSRQGYRVYGTIRRELKLDLPIQLLNMNVTDHASVKSAVETVIQKEGRIDVLINNAGFGIAGAIEDCDPQEVRLQMKTNFLGYVHVTKEILPFMRAQGGGLIVNISSIGGLMGLPYQGFYSASKFAVEGYSEALRMEVKPFRIKVVIIEPGDFSTSFTANRKSDSVAANSSPYYQTFRKAISIIENDEKRGLNPGILARKILKIINLKHPRSRYIVATFDQKLAVLLKKFLPASWFDKILASHYGVNQSAGKPK